MPRKNASSLVGKRSCTHGLPDAASSIYSHVWEESSPASCICAAPTGSTAPMPADVPGTAQGWGQPPGLLGHPTSAATVPVLQTNLLSAPGGGFSPPGPHRSQWLCRAEPPSTLLPAQQEFPGALRTLLSHPADFSLFYVNRPFSQLKRPQLQGAGERRRVCPGQENPNFLEPSCRSQPWGPGAAPEPPLLQPKAMEHAATLPTP